MTYINNFFTGSTGQNNFVLFGQIHLLILLVAIIGSLYILFNKKESRKTELIIGSVLVFQQVLLYSWYFKSNYNILTEGLPLYHCRISILLIGLGLLFKNKTFMKVGSYWGIFGSIAALLSPGVDPFTFPHITQFSFFIGHLFLLWGALYILFVKKIGMSSSDLKTALIFTNIYHPLMFIVNSNISSNYGYMNTPPISALSVLNPYIYSLGVIFTFNLILFIEYILINNIKIRCAHDKNINSVSYRKVA